MSDLISRSALIEEIRKFQDDLYFTNIYCDRTTLEGISSCLDNAISIIDEHPTAYDVDKVVEELEAETTALEDDYGDYVECIPESIVLKIVKGGGVNA